MGTDRPTNRHGSAALSDAEPVWSDHLTIREEAIYLRSYDHRWGYDLDVELIDSGGTPVFQKRYYLLPGHVESETLSLDPDEYEVRVTLDNRTERTVECLIDEAPHHTAVIEVGNGVVALSNGLRA